MLRPHPWPNRRSGSMHSWPTPWRFRTFLCEKGYVEEGAQTRLPLSRVLTLALLLGAALLGDPAWAQDKMAGTDADRQDASQNEMVGFMFRYFCITLGLLLGPSISVNASGLTLKLISITSPVPPGGQVTLVIASEPAAVCSGRRQGHFGQEISLTTSTAESDGRVQWSWPIRSGQKPVGIRGVRVKCIKGTRQGSLDTAFDVR